MTYHTIPDICSLLIEYFGVLYFYQPLQPRTEGRRRWFGYLCLAGLALIYFPSNAMIQALELYTVENLLTHLLRTAINWFSVYGYLYFTNEKKPALNGYLAGFYVLIYTVAFNLWQACACWWQPLPLALAWNLRIPFFIVVQWGLAFVLRRSLNLDRVASAGADRWLLIVTAVFLQLYFKWSQLSQKGAASLRLPDAVFYPACATVGILVIVVLFEIAAAAQQERSRLEMDQLQMRYEMQNAKRTLQVNNDIRRLYHDMKNHLLAMQSMMESGGEADAYLQDLRHQFEGYEATVNTGNPVVDALVAEKIHMGRLDDITFNVCLDLTTLGHVRSMDLITIFGNAIDNAIEALQMLPEGTERVIYLKSVQYANMTVLRFSNQFAGRLERSEGRLRTAKLNPELHGIGLDSIRKAAKRYGGSATVEFENKSGWFRLMVLLPQPEEAQGEASAEAPADTAQ